MIEQIEARIKEIETALEQSVLNHNGLLTRLDESKVMLEMAKKAVDNVVEEVVEVVEVCE